MKITVFGASGKVGRLIVQKLLDEEHDVTVFVHRSSPFTEVKNLHIVKGDVYNLSDVAMAIKGSEVVISALGSWDTKQKDIVGSGINNIVSAMSTGTTKRIVTLTGTDGKAEDDKESLIGQLLHDLISISPAGRILKDGEKHIQLLQYSKLDWTIVRSPIMNTKGNPAHFTLSNQKPRPWATINRQSVADAMVEVISKPEYYRKAPYVRKKVRG